MLYLNLESFYTLQYIFKNIKAHILVQKLFFTESILANYVSLFLDFIKYLAELFDFMKIGF